MKVKKVVLSFDLDHPIEETVLGELDPDPVDGHELVEIETTQGRIHVYPDGAVLKFEDDAKKGTYLQYGI
jgi:hypothetical protein